MASRLALQTELELLLGSRNVYFQPPESKKLKYDCIIYFKESINTNQANNKNYILTDCYRVTLIYRDPDSEMPKNIIKHFSYCKHINHVVVDNLYHDVFELYY